MLALQFPPPTDAWSLARSADGSGLVVLKEQLLHPDHRSALSFGCAPRSTPSTSFVDEFIFSEAFLQRPSYTSSSLLRVSTLASVW